MSFLLRAVLLAPVAVVQAIWVIRRAHRLSEPPGARQGVHGDGPPLRLLICGDSSAAGVGADTQSQALAGRLVFHLAQSHRVEWRLVAQCGDTAAGLRLRLLEIEPAPFDVAVVALGVNDSKNLHSRSRWRRNMITLFDLLGRRFQCPKIVMSGLPPVGQFPILPRPLRGLLGQRAAAFDDDLIEISRDRTDVQHLPMTLEMTPADMARDGFHPGPEIYDAWACLLAQHIRKIM